MTQSIFALILFLFPLAYSPGPGNMAFAANGARFGVAATIPASLGYHLATWGVTLAVGLGAMTVLQAVPGLFQALKLAGVAYVLWLAWGLMRAQGMAEGQARPIGFVDGVMLLVLNPKAYLIMGLMFAQFLGGDLGDGLGAVLLVTTVFTLNNLVAFSVWTALGQQIGRLFGAGPGMNRALGVVLAGVALWMLLA